MLKSGFFNSLNGDRKYAAAEFAAYFANFVGNGIFVRETTANLQVSAFDNMTVKVGTGYGFILGYYAANDAIDYITIPTASGVYPRYDRVVLRLNLTTRQIEFAVIEGEPAASPVVPELVRDGTFFDLGLAVIKVPKACTLVTDSYIEDTRADNAVCGWVTALVEQINTSTLFNQYKAAWYEFVEQLEQGSTQVTILAKDDECRADIVEIKANMPISLMTIFV